MSFLFGGVFFGRFRESGKPLKPLPKFASFKDRTHDIRSDELPEYHGGPNGIRTRVLALRGPRPRPLDDGTIEMAGERGFEPL